MLSMKSYQLATRPDYSDSFSLLVYSLMIANGAVVFFLEYILPKLLPGKIKLETDENGEVKKEYTDSIVDNCDFYARVSVTWFNPFLMQACKDSLSYDALPNVDLGCDSQRSSEIFKKNWDNRDGDEVSDLLKALALSFGQFVLIAAAFEAMYDILDLLQPFLTRQLILFATSYWEGSPQPYVYGIYIALGGFAIIFLRSAFQGYLLLYLIRAVVMVRGSLSSLVYQKSLRLSAQSRKERNMGEIVNLMSVDTETVVELVWSLSDLWEAPIKFFMSIFSLNLLLGSSVWIAFPILIVTFPAYYMVARRLKAIRKIQMKYNDNRTKITNEILLNIKSLKLYGWEKALLLRLDEARNGKQLGNYRRLIWTQSLVTLMWTLIPACIAVGVFGSFVYLKGIPLTADIVFPAVTLFQMMTGQLNTLPNLITNFIDTGVSTARIRDFLIAEEVDNTSVIREDTPAREGEAAVSVVDGKFSWDNSRSSASNALKSINLTALKGQLVCIVGRVGTGKSALLKSLLGELHKDEGSVVVKGSIAYVPQEPWLMNTTLKENVLFGHRYDPEFYQKAIKACALIPDLAILPDGDETEIGERGVSLSGGQKARVALARAVYARADVYIMDDPLAAVDEHVGKHLVDNVLGSTGVLASKTKILATNSIRILSHADSINLIEDKTIRENGAYTEVIEDGGYLHDLIKEFGSKEVDHVSSSNSSSTAPDESSSIVTDDEGNTENEDIEMLKSRTSDRRTSEVSLRRASVASLKRVKRRHSVKGKTAKNEEKSQQGRVKVNVYKKYIEACGFVPTVSSLIIIGLIGTGGFVTQIWLKSWTESNFNHHANYRIVFWLSGYAFLRGLQCILKMSSVIVSRIYAGLRASAKLHDRMALTVLRSPMSFFDTTPVGRIINRFSSDISVLDGGLTVTFIMTLECIISLCFSFATMIYAAPAVAIMLVFSSVVYFYFQGYYQTASRDLRRLLSVSKSPIYSHFQESLTGVVTIRAFDQLARFKHLHFVNVDNNLRSLFLFRSCSRWLNIRLQTVAACIIFVTCMSAVYASSKLAISPGMVGVLMFYTVSATDMLSFVLKFIVQLENNVVAVERVLEYCELPMEKAEIVEGNRPQEDWPQEGEVIYKNYSARYRENLELILKDINLHIKPKEKVGVVGRTGAGKSSLIMSLFRMIEPAEGTIIIDKVDISKIGLLDLRSNLSVIPQDSQVFQGTIRQNLDPVGRYTDQKLWRALELSHLKEHVKSLEGQLEAELSEGGSNLSAGQRQLMCLGRALLHQSSILVLDEATASVDAQTDKFVQQTIRSEFKDRTIITIAHRLDTIIDSDKIAVLDQGKVVEFDTPQALLAKPDSIFYSLAKQGGLVSNE